MNEREIFVAALHQPDAGARAALVHRECGDDRALRERIEALLREQEELGSFLERPAQGLAATGAFTPVEGDPHATAAAEALGMAIGPYKLLQEIGEGGMGTVYMAQQIEPVKRLVALKVIKPGMDSRQVIARFEAERQALALMDHPNIAKVFDAGTTSSGRPYFVMELVKGVPLTKYCDERRLIPRERLELFIPVCQAIQHAHQKGIIHRDIKPSNVLVALYDGKPVPKVIDFGVAKAAGQQLTEHTLVTTFGAVVGTLEYMSPEQAELNQLDIDTRSDIYSLGVLLYELLTGSTPLDRKRLKEAAMLEVLRLIREEEPPRPSTRLSTTEELASVAAKRGLEPKKLSGLVRGELDWIVMRALEKDRNRRYETANGFALDLQRYLADEPVQACPPSAWYRLRKFARRNKGSLTAAAVVCMVLVLATVISTWQAIRATEASAAERETRKGLDKALVAEKAALGEAKASALVADKHRQAAEASRQAMQINLADMNTTQGLIADERGKPAQAVLWFANAARLAQGDPERESSNRVRARSWRRKTLTPLAALSTNDPVRAMVFHPGSEYLLALSMTGKLILWDIRKDRAMPLPGERRAVGSAVWSPDGTLLAVGDADGLVEILAFPSGKLLRRTVHQGAIRALAFNAAGSQLAIASKIVRVWNVQSQTFAAGEMVHPQPVETLLFNPKGNRLATGCRDNLVRVFSVTEKEVGAQPLFTPVAHVWCPNENDIRHGTACGPLYIDGGKALLTRADYSGAAWWDAETGKLVRRLPAPPRGGLFTLAADPSGRYVVLCGRECHVWDTVRARQVAGPMPMRHDIASASFSNDGRVLITGSLDNTFRLWSLPEGRMLVEHDLHDMVGWTFISPDGRLVAAGTGWGFNFVRVWCAAEGTPSRPTTPAWSTALAPQDSPFALSRDGRYFVSSGLFGRPHISGMKTQVHEVATGKPAGVPLRALGPIINAEFSPDQRRVVLLSYRPESPKVGSGAIAEVSAWEWQTGRPVFAPVVLPIIPNDLSYSADGTSLAVSGSEGQVFLLDAATGKVRGKLGDFQSSGGKIKPGSMTAPKRLGLHRVGFDPDSKNLLAWGRATEVRVWELSTGRMRTLTSKGGDWCSDLRFSADGRLCTAGGAIWDFASGQLRAMLPRHPAMIFANRFSPDARHLATACRDGTIRVWDWRTGRLACPPLQHRLEAWDVLFTPDGRRIASTAWDFTARLWDVQTGKLIAPAFDVPGHGCQVETDPAGHFLITSGQSFLSIPVFDLKELSQTDRLPPDDLCMWAELVSGQQLHEGGDVVNLSINEWLSRWQSFRKRWPTHLDANWSIEFKQAWQRREAEGRRALGSKLAAAGQLDEAIVLYRQALTLWPDDATAHHELGNVLVRQTQLDEALIAHGHAVRLQPASSEYHYERGNAQRLAGKLDEAVASFEAAIQLDPGFAEAHCNLGFALLMKGRFIKARAARQRGHELGSTSPAWPYDSKQWVRECDRLVELERRLPSILRREAKPADAAERAEFAWVCYLKRHYAAAARLYEEVFAEGPELAGNAQSGRRLDAARAAAQAGLGQGEDAASLDDKARARWRKQALAWLRAELTMRANSLKNAAPSARTTVQTNLKLWQLDPDVAGMREAGLLAKLPRKEQDDWRGFWADVAKAQEPGYNPGRNAGPAVVATTPGVHVGQELDLAGPTVKGEKLDLRQLRGKVVLVDFWATWCGPCIAEMPNVKDVYDRYHSDGFEVVGISLDNSREALERFVKQKAVAWPQIFFENRGEQGWNNPLARKYGIHGIPSTALVDRTGRVVQVNLRGEALGLAVAKLLGKPPPPITADGWRSRADALQAKGDLAGAIALYHKAIALEPTNSITHYHLGNALMNTGRLDDAIAQFQAAIRINKDYAEAHCNLGHALRRKGEYRQALAELRRGHKLGEAMGERWRYPSKQWAQYCEHLVDLEGRLPDFVEGKSTPASPVERIELAQICSLKGLNRAAARFYKEGFDAEPRLANVPGGVHRYNAACAAALAGCGKGKDAGKLDDKERVRLRRQALEWLQADLEAWSRLLDKEKHRAGSVASVTKTMRLWLADGDFAGVRGPAALAKLPEAERARWQKLWSDVAATLTRAEAAKTSEKKSKTI